MPSDDFEVLHRGETTQVKEVSSCADVASFRPLSLSQMREVMLDGNAFAKACATRTGFQPRAQFLLQSFVIAHRDAAPTAGRCLSEVDPIVRTIFRPPTFASRDSVLS